MTWLDPILLPLARLAIRKGWLFRDLENGLKKAYIGAALSLTDGTATDSKISIMTGLQRRDVAALRKLNDVPSKRQPLAEIIALWWNEPNYPNDNLPVQGTEFSFSTLARSVRQDVHPRTFLDLLIENGAATEEGTTVSLKTRSYTPLPGTDDQMTYLAENVGDHLNAAVGNVVDAAHYYDMAVHYSGLSENAVKELDGLFRLRLNAVLKEIDTRAQELPRNENGPHRFRAGGYFYDDEIERSRPNDT